MVAVPVATKQVGGITVTVGAVSKPVGAPTITAVWAEVQPLAFL